MYCVLSMVGVVPSMVGVAQLYRGVQCCMCCIPSMVGVVTNMVGVVPSYTVECNAACTVDLVWWAWYLAW